MSKLLAFPCVPVPAPLGGLHAQVPRYTPDARLTLTLTVAMLRPRRPRAATNSCTSHPSRHSPSRSRAPAALGCYRSSSGRAPLGAPLNSSSPASIVVPTYMIGLQMSWYRFRAELRVSVPSVFTYELQLNTAQMISEVFFLR